MTQVMKDEIKRWTAWKKSALVIDCSARELLG